MIVAGFLARLSFSYVLLRSSAGDPGRGNAAASKYSQSLKTRSQVSEGSSGLSLRKSSAKCCHPSNKPIVMSSHAKMRSGLASKSVPFGARKVRRRLSDAFMFRVAWTVLLEKTMSKAPAGNPCSGRSRSRSSLLKRRNGKAEKRSRARSKNAGVTSVYQYSVRSAGRSGRSDAVLLPVPAPTSSTRIGLAGSLAATRAPIAPAATPLIYRSVAECS